ncbi:MAG: metallophosphoesterase [Acidobacteriota bacterium]|nr:metallophosphoesterase [Acidobacteriota bacterium]
MRTLIASDWHLGHYSPPRQVALAAGFLLHVRRRGDRLVLNGDIFEGLFEPVARAETAHPALAAAIADLIDTGQAQRTEGNHDPGTGAPFIVLEHPAAGRVLVMHGHRVDATGAPSEHAGDRISRRFGHLAVVRGFARTMEAAVSTLAAGAVDRLYRRHCLACVERHGCDLGVFGHNHRRYLAADDRYANAGCLRDDRLEFLVLDEHGPRLASFGTAELAASPPLR